MMENYTTAHTPHGDESSSLLGFYARDILQNNRRELAFVLVISMILYRVYYWKKSYLHLPYIGIPSGLLGPWKAGFNFFQHSEEYIREGYQKFHPTRQPYVLAMLPRYLVFVTDPEQIEELRRAKETELSFNRATERRMRIAMTTDPSMTDGVNDYHLDIIRQNLTQRLAAMLPEVQAEVDLAWNETTKIGDDWTRVKPWGIMLEVIARTSNRLFVGTPLCRNKEYLDIMLQYATRMSFAGMAADHAPFFLRHAVVWYLLKRHRYRERVAKILGPIFDERKRLQKELGEERWKAEKPNDAIQWVLDATANRSKEQQSYSQLAMRIITLNFAAIHTTTLSILHVLYDITAHPECIEPLRNDIISVLDAHGGYTKQSLTMMKKLDSVLKESQRLNGVSSLILTRMALSDYTFKSGRHPLTIPKGTFVAAPATAIHRSNDIYGEDASEFKAFRFSELREDKDSAAKHQMVSTNSGYLAFGHGVHACPGRFFAANELKVLLSYILLRYDVRLPAERGGKRPPNTYQFGVVRADTTVELEFKPREQWKDLEHRWDPSGQE